MDKINILRYAPSDRKIWDSFVAEARNSTFLFQRDYMDYHADRFTDHSLMAYSGSRLMAILPADIDPADALHSHRGLTYGGWLLPRGHVDGSGVLNIFSAMIEYCRKEGIKRVFYKPLPFIYAQYPSQEDIYALFRCGGVVDSVNLSSAVDLLDPLSFNTLQRRLLRKAQKAIPDREMEMSPPSGKYDVAPFWNMLALCLAERHDAVPVHSCGELQLLRDRFPEAIRIFMIKDDAGNPAAGVCVLENRMVAHCQYICTSAEGRRLNLLPLLFNWLITEIYAPENNLCADSEIVRNKIRYFDFGTSNEADGRVLNEGLLRQKFSFGGTGVAYMRYKIDIDVTSGK